MRKLLSVLLLVFASANAVAQAGNVVVSERTVMLEVPISPTTVILSSADYSAELVKILIPNLADVTLLNHRNSTASAPCVATYETHNPADVIKNNSAKENIPFQIKLIRTTTPAANGRCQVSLTETVEGNVRGFKFQHLRYQEIGERHIDDCR
jgi:hypothetical protein